MERDDFMEDAPKKYFRMTPGQEVRLKNAYIVKCTGCKKNDAGEITEVYCEYDPDTKSGLPGANRKVKGTIHWVSCATASKQKCASTTVCGKWRTRATSLPPSAKRRTATH